MVGWPISKTEACSSNSTSAMVTRAVMKPNHSRDRAESVVDAGTAARPAVSAAVVPAMGVVVCTSGFGAAVQRQCAGHRVALGQVQATHRAGHDVVRWRQGLGLAFGRFGGGVARVAVALVPPEPDNRHHHQQQNEVFHSMRPSTTSNTKREPT